MSKNAKTASKNNPTARAQATKYLFEGKEIKPVKIILHNKNFFGAEYDSGDLVINQSGSPLSWQQARILATRS